MSIIEDTYVNPNMGNYVGFNRYRFGRTNDYKYEVSATSKGETELHTQDTHMDKMLLFHSSSCDTLRAVSVVEDPYINPNPRAMMRFNTGRFNKYKRYEINIDVNANSTDNVQAVAFNNQKEEFISTSTDILRGESDTLGKAVSFYTDSTDCLSGDSVIHKAIKFYNTDMQQTFHAYDELGKSIRFYDSMANELEQTLIIGKCTKFYSHMEENLIMEAVLGKGIYSYSNSLDVMYAASDLQDVKYGYIELAVTIPAGGKLVVNSSNYTVLLNGSNYIYAHSGEWLHMDRDVIDITLSFSGNSSNISSKIGYNERWL